jgi:hypothetical protein
MSDKIVITKVGQDPTPTPKVAPVIGSAKKPKTMKGLET